MVKSMIEYDEKTLFDSPFVIYQLYIQYQNEYGLWIQQMEIDENVGKIDSLHEYFAKTHQRVIKSGDRYSYANYFRYIYDIINRKALVYLPSTLNSNYDGTLFLTTNAEPNNIDPLCQLIADSKKYRDELKIMGDIYNNALEPVQLVTLTNQMDQESLKMALKMKD